MENTITEECIEFIRSQEGLMAKILQDREQAVASMIRVERKYFLGTLFGNEINIEVIYDFSMESE